MTLRRNPLFGNPRFARMATPMLFVVLLALAGCAKQKTATPPSAVADVSVYFEHGENTLLPEEVVKVGEALAKMKGDPDTRVLIVGHADASGPAKLNDIIARERAEHVAHLITRDYPEFATRLRLASVGEQEANSDQQRVSAEERAKDRRVSIHYYKVDAISDEDATLAKLFDGKIRLQVTASTN